MFGRLGDFSERGWCGKVEVEVGFVDQFGEFDGEPIEKLEVIDEDIPNLVDARMEIGFHDQLDGSNMEIVECLVVDD